MSKEDKELFWGLLAGFAFLAAGGLGAAIPLVLAHIYRIPGY